MSLYKCGQKWRGLRDPSFTSILVATPIVGSSGGVPPCANNTTLVSGHTWLELRDLIDEQVQRTHPQV